MTSPDPSAQNLLQGVLDLCRFRRGPQDLPYSPNLLGALFIAGTVVDVAGSSLLGSAEGALGHSLLLSVLVLGLCWVALSIRKLGNRYVQAATALLACGLLFSLLQFPIAWLAGPAPANSAGLTATQVLLGWLLFVLFVWLIAVAAHIMRHAMDSSFAFALMLVATWVIAYFALERVLFV
jgi:hypothetical protein